MDLNCSTTDQYLQYLLNSNNLITYKNINLSECKKITDNGLKYLSNSKNLINCEKLNLNLSYTKITDQGFEYLKKARPIDIKNPNITDAEYEYLCLKYDLMHGKKITNEFIKQLSDAYIKSHK